MKKSALVFSLVAVASLATAAFGQLPAANESSLWWDIRDNDTSHGTTGGVGGQDITGTPANPYTNGQDPTASGSAVRFGDNAYNSGGRGAGGVLRLNPVQVSGFHAVANPNGAGSGWPNYPIGPGTGAGDGNAATGSLYLYMDMNDDTSGGPAAAENMAAVGVDTVIANGPLVTAARNPIALVSMSVYNDSTVAARAGGTPPGAPWNGTAAGATDGGTPPSIIGTKMVRIAVSNPGGGAVYDEALGLQPGVGANKGPYRLARLDVVAGTRNCTARQANNHVDNSTYSVRSRVNNLLITRTFESGGDTQEDVRPGFNPYSGAGNPGALALTSPALNGNTNGDVSASAGAVIQMRLRGDYSGDGNVTNIDLNPHLAAIAASAGGTIKVRQVYLGDFNGNRTVTNIDQSGFLKAISASTTCP
jgi:hypothetical protein